MYDAQFDPRAAEDSAEAWSEPGGGAPGVDAGFLLGMLDEIDYGLAVVDEQARPVLMNQLARAELGWGRFVQLREGRLAASADEQAPRLDKALQDAGQGLRSLLSFGRTEEDLALSFIPLRFGHDGLAPARRGFFSLVMFSKREACARLTLQQFGHQHRLTRAEQALLPSISRGLSADDIAQEHRVAVSTVRSQLCSIREKTGAKSLRSLVVRLNRLPPIRSSLRHAHAPARC